MLTAALKAIATNNYCTDVYAEAGNETMSHEEELVRLKAFAIERSRDPAEGCSARQRALMACLVIPNEIQKWMLDAGAVEPLLDSLEKTILAAEEAARAEPFKKERDDG